ncbi:MAG: ParA family protein [Pseudomonadales bacterium]|nr:ParA family protein [Pseudomonadales bacterium]
MTRTLAVANQKGGVGKTTTSVNLAASLAEFGVSVLLVDMDPQANATAGAGVNRTAESPTAYHWLLGYCSFDESCCSANGGYTIIPSSGDLTAAELALLNAPDRNFRLSRRMRESPGFEYTIIDCPPSLNVLTVNALNAASGVLVPMQCEYLALEGLSALLSTVDGVRRSGNRNLELDGIVRTMYDPRNSLSREVSRQLFDHFRDAVYRTVIPRNVKLAEAPSHGLPGLLYDSRAKGSVAYRALAREMIEKHRNRNAAGLEKEHA